MNYYILKPRNLRYQSLKWLSTSSLPRNRDQKFSIIAALKHCAVNSSIYRGQAYHALITKSGLNHNTFIQNSLINLYVKCRLISEAKRVFDSATNLSDVSSNIMLSGFLRSGLWDDAREVFDRMSEKGCVSYTTMILGLVQGKFYGEAVGVFGAMRVAGVQPSEVTMAHVIAALTHCDVGGDIAGRLHGLVMKLGIDGFLHVGTNLVNLYCLGGRVANGRRLFDEMPERNVVTWNVMLRGHAKAGNVELAREFFESMEEKDVVSWGTIINCYVKVRRLNEAVMIYCEMVDIGLSPNDAMIGDIILACGRTMSLSLGQQFHGVALRRGFDSYDIIQSTVIHFYGTCQKIDLAYLQLELGNKDHLPSWNALLGGLIQSNLIDHARRLFNEMPEKDIFSWTTMLSGYSQTGKASLALELFNEMVANGVRPNEVTMVSVISSVAALGSLSDARRAHEYILVNSIPLNDHLNAAIIDMYGKCGCINSALQVFHQIQEKAQDISPWNAIICGCAMHGHEEMALTIFADLEKYKMKPNAVTFVGVLSACCQAGLIEIGEKHFENMKGLYNIEPNIKHYGCMVDLLGRAGRLEEAERLIHKMPMKADVVIWAMLLAACRTHGNSELAERAAANLASVSDKEGQDCGMMHQMRDKQL